jgi:transposase
LLIHAVVHAADIQDRDGGALVMATMFGMYPFLLKLYADGGYQGPVFRRAVTKIMTQVNVEIVRRSDRAKGFVVLPKRWVVERTFAWCQRRSKNASVCRRENTSMIVAKRPPNWGPFRKASGFGGVIRGV